METLKYFFSIFFLFGFLGIVQAQTIQDIEALEFTYKECLLAKTDTSICGKTFLRQMDSVLSVVYDKVWVQLTAKEKVNFMKEQQNWSIKKEAFNKKQDENFVYNLKEGTWMPNMIWLVYENKADFIKKRAVSLAKRLD